MLDIVIINVPGTITDMPLLAPALLKSVVVQHGFTCKTIDFNAKFYNSSISELKDVELYFITNDACNLEATTIANKLIDQWANEIVVLNPVYVAISVFTCQSQTATRLLCKKLKQIRPAIKIILGGQGLTVSGLNGKMGFAKELLDSELIDFYIKSEGERSLVELLKGNTSYPGINSDYFDQIKDLDSLPVPDYSDYDFALYPRPALIVVNSRGCVRRCTFCDVHEHWKYNYRSGKSAANEIIELHKVYGIKDFVFADSLVNGNLKMFVEFLEIMSDYNKTTGAEIKWSGQYIVRSKKQIPRDYWKKLSESGAHKLGLGVETGSDVVRAHMKKQFTNTDLDYTVEMLHQHNITCTFLLIIGYPTETLANFNDTITMLERYKPYANCTISEIEFGTTLGIFPGTPLYKNAAYYNIELDTHENNWIAYNNEELTLSERLWRREYARKYATELGYTLSPDMHGAFLESLKKMYPVFEQRNKVKKLIKLTQQK